MQCHLLVAAPEKPAIAEDSEDRAIIPTRSWKP